MSWSSVPATRSNKQQNLVGLLLTLGVANLPLSTWGGRLKVFGPLLAREVLWGLAVGVLLFYVLRVERRPLSSIGFRRLGLRDILPAIVAGILMVVGIVVIYSSVFPRFHLQMNTGMMNTLMASPFWYRFILVTRGSGRRNLVSRVSHREARRAYRQPLDSCRDLMGCIYDCSSCCLGLATACSGWIRRRHIDRTLSVATEPVFKHNCSLDRRWLWISSLTKISPETSAQLDKRSIQLTAVKK
jgi:hypothetical protein